MKCICDLDFSIVKLYDYSIRTKYICENKKCKSDLLIYTEENINEIYFAKFICYDRKFGFIYGARPYLKFDLEIDKHSMERMLKYDSINQIIKDYNNYSLFI